MTNIWVTGASSLIGYGILQSIRSAKKPYKLIGSTIHKDSIAPAFTDVCFEAPFSGSAGYINWVISVIKDYNVDLVIPSFEEDVNFLNEHRDQIELTGAKVVLNNFKPMIPAQFHELWKKGIETNDYYLKLCTLEVLKFATCISLVQ